jgi:hypothetical protein
VQLLCLLLLCRFYTPAWEATAGSTANSQARPSQHVNTQAAPLGHKGLNPAANLDVSIHPTTRQHQQVQQVQQQEQRQQQTGPVSGGGLGVAAGVPHGPLDTGRSFFSFEMGGVHFLMLDTESPSDPGSPQGMFVAADLAKVRVAVAAIWRHWITCLSPRSNKLS